MSIRHLQKPGTSTAPRGPTPYGVAYCGYELRAFDFTFVDVQHAQSCIEQQALVQPCKKCMRAALRDNR